MRQFARQHPLVVFVVLAYAISWSYWIPLAVKGYRIVPGGSVTHFPGLLGPAIAAYVTTALVSGRDGLRELTRRLWLVSRPPGRFWLYSLSPLLFLLAAFVIASVAGDAPSIRGFAVYSGLPRLPFVVVLILVMLFNGFGEEIGWRGFALPAVRARYGLVTSALIVAMIWAGWHIPTFWTVEGYRAMSIPVLIGGFAVGLACGSIVLAKVSSVTGGSILAAAIWHTMYNIGSATAASRGLIGAITTACVEIWAVVLVFAAVRRSRVQADQVG